MGNPRGEAGCRLFAKISVFARVVVVVLGGGSSVRFISCFGYYFWGAHEVSRRGVLEVLISKGLEPRRSHEPQWGNTGPRTKSLKKLRGDEDRPRSSQKIWKNWTEREKTQRIWNHRSQKMRTFHGKRFSTTQIWLRGVFGVDWKTSTRLFFFFFFATPLDSVQDVLVPPKEINLCLLQRKLRDLTTCLPGKSLEFYINLEGTFPVCYMEVTVNHISRILAK